MATIAERVDSGSSVEAGSIAAQVAPVGGVEEEFIFEGTATQYRLAGGRGADYPPDGRWDAEPGSQAPFRSRLQVVRPGDPAAFNGTVIVTWNSGAMQAPMLIGATAKRMLEDGFAVAAVTANREAIEGSRGLTEEESEYFGEAIAGKPGLRGIDPERYGTLEHPGDGYSYDVYRQGAELVGPERTGAIDPMGGLDVRHTIAIGASHTACRLSTYLNALQPHSSAISAFLLIVSPNTPMALDPADAPERLPEIGPNAGVTLMGWRKYLVRDDLEVPTIIVNSEFEAEQCYPNVEPETEYVRTWEFAGTSHLAVVSQEEFEDIAPISADLSWCMVKFTPAVRGALHGLHRWLDGGTPPPHQPRLARNGDELVRDEHGNAVGGIRLPELEAPLATHVGESPRGGFVQMMGTSTPFPPEKVKALYPDKASWLARYDAAVDHLVATEVILADDAASMRAKAEKLELPV